MNLALGGIASPKVATHSGLARNRTLSPFQIHFVFTVLPAASGYAFVALAGPVSIYTPVVVVSFGAGAALVVPLLVATALLRLRRLPTHIALCASFTLPQWMGLGLLALTYVAAAAPCLLLATTPLGSMGALERALPEAMGLATGMVVYTALALVTRQLNLRWLSAMPVVVAGAASLAYGGHLPWGHAFALVNALVGVSVSMAFLAPRGRPSDVV